MQDIRGTEYVFEYDLKSCFPDTWKQILSLAYHLIMEDRNPLSRFPRWAASRKLPGNINETGPGHPR